MATQNKVRFNVVDFLLVLLVILSVVALVLRPKVLEKISEMTATETVVVNFYADQLSEEECNALTVGDLLTVGEGENGELLSYSILPYKTLQLIESDAGTENAFFKEVTEPDLYTVKGQLRLTGSRQQDGFYVGGTMPVGVGSILEIQSDSYILTLEIVGIS